MDDPSAGDRKSKAASPELVQDPDERARREVDNGLRQFDNVVALIEQYRDEKRQFKLRPSIIVSLQRVALDGISSFAGLTRPSDITISGSRHQPPGAHLVLGLVEELCDYVNEHWEASSAVHLAAYVMWRINWIHPFDDGNGRTSRAVSYLVLCMKLGYPLPGTNTIPEQIAANKTPYYAALEEADAAWDEGRVDVSRLEELLGACLSAQLVQVVEQATGTTLQ
jgi:fido (protein-threonine AMPylation protein)